MPKPENIIKKGSQNRHCPSLFTIYHLPFRKQYIKNS